ncbi:MAG: DUF1772 domain-containing protein [Proteobacteria bacterium]|nr:DUF1772 domain-containing protein [Pseudomonadota bacterium]MDA1357269.1 DUF1772 domain-containing protein [Pseudomonadota bacterium]
MPDDWIVYACLAAGICSGLVAGVFLSFSDFIMRSLVAARPASGIEAMQMINRKVVRTWFLVMLLGMAPASVALAGYAYFNLSAPTSLLIIAGAAIYLVFVVLVTMFYNVPMNNRLSHMDPFAEESVNYWKIYGAVWTRWNHARTLGSLASALCFLFASIALS